MKTQQEWATLGGGGVHLVYLDSLPLCICVWYPLNHPILFVGLHSSDFFLFIFLSSHFPVSQLTFIKHRWLVPCFIISLTLRPSIFVLLLFLSHLPPSYPNSLTWFRWTRQAWNRQLRELFDFAVNPLLVHSINTAWWEHHLAITSPDN